MSEPVIPEVDAAGRSGFDPERFFELARRVGHGRALGLEYRASGPNWMELALPWREELVGVPESGVSDVHAVSGPRIEDGWFEHGPIEPRSSW